MSYCFTATLLHPDDPLMKKPSSSLLGYSNWKKHEYRENYKASNLGPFLAFCNHFGPVLLVLLGAIVLLVQLFPNRAKAFPCLLMGGMLLVIFCKRLEFGSHMDVYQDNSHSKALRQRARLNLAATFFFKSKAEKIMAAKFNSSDKAESLQKVSKTP